MRPSELYGIEDRIAAYSFDKAVFLFGTSLEAEMEQAAEKAKTTKAARTKAQQVLNKWLTEPGEPGRFRDPMSAR